MTLLTQLFICLNLIFLQVNSIKKSEKQMDAELRL